MQSQDKASRVRKVVKSLSGSERQDFELFLLKRTDDGVKIIDFIGRIGAENEFGVGI